MRLELLEQDIALVTLAARMLVDSQTVLNEGVHTDSGVCVGKLLVTTAAGEHRRQRLPVNTMTVQLLPVRRDEDLVTIGTGVLVLGPPVRLDVLVENLQRRLGRRLEAEAAQVALKHFASRSGGTPTLRFYWSSSGCFFLGFWSGG